MNTSLNYPALDLWPQNAISLTEPSTQLLDEFTYILNDASDEKPLQIFLSKNPIILRVLLPSARYFWCFDRPKFGNQYIPDFLLCCEFSTGYNWTLVEIESPTKNALNSRGRMSSSLTEAIGQINDWRIWLRKNIAYSHAELGFNGIDAECPAIIIIGRRALLNRKHINQYKEFLGIRFAQV
jgi:hypothetical protein